MTNGVGNGGTDGDGSFDARLRAARERRGMDPRPVDPLNPKGAPPMSAMGVGLRVGVELLAALVVGLAIGWGLDRWLKTAPIFLALFVVLGGVAGVMNVWRLLKPGAKPGAR